MKTIRARLLLYTSAATASVLVAAALAIYFLTRASLYVEFDRALLATSRSVQVAAEQHARGVRIEANHIDLPEFNRAESPDFYEFWLEPGSVLDRSKSLISANLDLPRPTTATSDPVISNGILPDGRAGRQTIVRFIPNHDDLNRPGRPAFTPKVVTLVVARHTGPLAARLRELRWLLLIVGVTATAVIAMTLHLAVSRGLRPLNALATQIASTGQGNLLTPIELPDTPAELSIVVKSLNEMLARLHDAISRERAFASDVSHELRTPLAGLEVTLEIASLRERTPADYDTRIRKSLGIVQEMRSMVDNLLTLARAEAGQLAVNQIDLDINQFVEACWSNYQDAADDRCLTSSLDLESLHVRSDADKLRIVLHNLMDNAIAYCDPGGHISIVVRKTGDLVQFTISNPCRSISPAQAKHVFDRFWRADTSRANTGVHCGLGLSLCEKIVHLMGAKLEVHISESQTFQVQLTLPNLKTSPLPSPVAVTA